MNRTQRLQRWPQLLGPISALASDVMDWPAPHYYAVYYEALPALSRLCGSSDSPLPLDCCEDTLIRVATSQPSTARTHLERIYWAIIYVLAHRFGANQVYADRLRLGWELMEVVLIDNLFVALQLDKIIHTEYMKAQGASLSYAI